MTEARTSEDSSAVVRATLQLVVAFDDAHEAEQLVLDVAQPPLSSHRASTADA